MMATPFNIQPNSLGQNLNGQYNSYPSTGQDFYSPIILGPSDSTTNTNGSNYLAYNANGYANHSNSDSFTEPNNILPINSTTDLENLITATQKLYITLVKSAQEARDILKQKSSTHWKNPALYKTTICDHYRAKKKCKYGAKCWYAHGTHELRYVPRLDQIPSLDSLKLNDGISSFDTQTTPFEVYQKGSTASELFEYGQHANGWSNSNRQYIPTSYGNNAALPSHPFTSNYGLDDQLQSHHSSSIFGTDNESLLSSPSMPSPQRHTPTQQFFSQLSANSNFGLNGNLAAKELKEISYEMQKFNGMSLESKKNVIIKAAWKEPGIQIEKPSNVMNIGFNEKQNEALFSKSYRPFDENYPLKSWI